MGFLFLSCPRNWDYEAKHPARRTKKLKRRCARLLMNMRRSDYPLLQHACDTRPIHGRMFSGMTPLCFSYFAGNYRGDARFKCLLDYRVRVPADPRVGTAPQVVETELTTLNTAILSFIHVVEAKLPNPSDPQRLIYSVRMLCYVLAEFLRIHPYANGNGHMGRFIVWALLLRLGYTPKSWPLEDRPPYGPSLTQWRNGDTTPLEMLLIRCIIS